jgi:hypothetical protein
MATRRKDAEQSAPATANGYIFSFNRYFYFVKLYIVIQVISPTFSPKNLNSWLQTISRFSNEQMEALNSDDLVATCDAFDCGINSLYVEQARVGAKTCLYVKEDEPSSCQKMAAEPYQSLGHLGLR